MFRPYIVLIISFLTFFKSHSQTKKEIEKIIKYNATVFECYLKEPKNKNCGELKALTSTYSEEIKVQIEGFNLGIKYFNSYLTEIASRPQDVRDFERVIISNITNSLKINLSLILFQLEAEELKTSAKNAIEASLKKDTLGFGVILHKVYGNNGIFSNTKTIKDSVNLIADKFDNISRKIEPLINMPSQVDTIYQTLRNDSTPYIIQLLNGGRSFWSLAGSFNLKENNFLDIQMGTFISSGLNSFVLGAGYGKSYRRFIFQGGVLINTNNKIEILAGTKTFNLYAKISAVLVSRKKTAFVPAINFSPLYGISVGLGIGINKRR